MSKSRSGKRYDAEFKQEAVRLLLSSGKTATQLASELGVSSWSLSQWKQDYLQAMDQSTVQGSPGSQGSVRSTAEVELENRQLRHELETVRRQRDLLKKAIAICSQEGLKEDRRRGMR